MRTFARAIFFAALLTGVFVASAEADTVYTYVGGAINYTTGVYVPGDSISGTFTLSSSFVPATLPGGQIDPFQYLQSAIVSYSFTDGHQTLTRSNSILGGFQFGFNADGTPAPPGNSNSDYGQVNEWDFGIRSNDGTSFISAYLGNDFGTFAGMGCIVFSENCTSVAIINGGVAPPEMDGTSGTWTMQVPEEGTTALFLLAGLAILTGLSGLKRVTRGL